jgi:protein subunit release factor B
VAELLFRVTAADCDWDYIRGSGAGGQHRNKTSSAVRCAHRASRAVGYSEDTRSQHDNKRTAFRRMAESDRFRAWHRLESMRRLGRLIEVDAEVDRQMRSVRVEAVENGRWVEVSIDDPLDMDV